MGQSANTTRKVMSRTLRAISFKAFTSKGGGKLLRLLRIARVSMLPSGSQILLIVTMLKGANKSSIDKSSRAIFRSCSLISPDFTLAEHFWHSMPLFRQKLQSAVFTLENALHHKKRRGGGALKP